MAGLYQSLLQAPTTPSVFGNAATTSALQSANDEKIKQLRQNVSNAQKQLNEVKSLNGNTGSQSPEDFLYDYYLGKYKDSQSNANYFSGSPEETIKAMARQNAEMTMRTLTARGTNKYYNNSKDRTDANVLLALLNNQAANNNNNSAVTSAQKAFTAAQNELNDALRSQAAQKAAGKDAVNWGLAAKNAEQQGIANAAQMYQDIMQGEIARNNLMNQAIGTVGNFGGGK